MRPEDAPGARAGGETPELDATLAPGTRPAERAPDPLGFPVPGWDRYQPLRLLGEGGMGRVFLARDVRLQREVALKFVKDGDPELARRFLFEARAQARVRHERVCEVYEVGEVAGRVYIAMEHIDGPPLSALVDALTVEQKALVLRDAALGVHEAHRAGLIHRDLKPSNILVARGADGALATYVMDFGLARSIHDGTTMTGAILGTPHFMAPEQARGEVSRLDRRTDVYALGATLYHLLTGAHPIPGANPLAVLSDVATVEPRPPRALAPHVPADLEAIVLQCLEKDRALRYDSARALADDLERFLAGEPVHARPLGVVQRVRRRLARNRRLTAVVAAATLAVLLALGWALVERSQAAERERLARRYAEVAERVEARARYADLAPLHDVRPTRRALRDELSQLEREIDEAGGVAIGPGLHALGRGHLALGDDARAHELLDAAWTHGPRSPELAYERALAMGHLYQRGLLAADRLGSPAEREARVAALRRELRDPALGLLSESTADTTAPREHVAALIAFYEERFEDALGHLDRAGQEPPWLHELPHLRGDVHLRRAIAATREARRDDARRDFAAGRAAYLEAAKIGESVAGVHRALAELEYAALMMELYAEGEIDPPYERGLAAAARALAADPDDDAAWVLEARFHRVRAEHDAARGLPVDARLDAAADALEHARALRPEGAEARFELALVHEQRAEDRVSRGLDPREVLAKALELVAGVGGALKGYDVEVLVGLAHGVWADWEDEQGEAGGEHRARAIAAYERALALSPTMTSAWINLGTAQLAAAGHAKDAEVLPALERAWASIDRARTLDPKQVVPHFQGGEIFVARAVHRREHGADPAPDLARALELYEAGLAIDATLPHLHNGVGGVHAEAARAAWDRGGDPGARVAEAERAYRRAIAVAPGQPYAHNNLGVLLAQAGAWARARGVDAEAPLAAAEEALRRAVALAPESGSFAANLGLVYALEAGARLERGRDPGRALALGTAALDRAIAASPKEPVAAYYRAELLAVTARHHTRAGRARAEDYAAAANAFERALQLAPDRPDELLLFGHFTADWAAWSMGQGRDASTALARGRTLVADLLERRPDWPEARVLAARLDLLAARATQDPAERATLGARATAELDAALAANRNLAPAAARVRRGAKGS